MKRRILLWGGVLFVIAITNSCSFFKKLASTDLETEEDFILEEISKEVPRPAPKPTVKPQNKKNKMNVTLCDKDNVQLYDAIETELSDKYVQYKKELGTANPRFGAVRGIDNKDDASSFFLKTSMQYTISSGYIYPIFGAFRSLLKFDESADKLEWEFDPVDMWNEIGKSLAQNTFESSSNPQLAGKDKQLWLSNYRIVETHCLRKLLNRVK